MAIKVIGDISVTYPDLGLNPNQAVAVEHYLSELGVIQVYEYDQDILTSILPAVPQMGNQVSIPRALGVNNFREVSVDGDRGFDPSGQKMTRVTGSRRAFDLDFEVKDDTQPEVQVSFVNDGLRRFRGAKARLGAQVVIDILDGINATDQNQEPNGLAAAIAAGVFWNDTTKAVETSGTPKRWNIPKLNQAKTILEYGNVQPGAQNMLALANALTFHGFSEDVQAIDRDYDSNTFMDLSWVKIGEFPNKPDGTPGGFKRVVTGTAPNTTTVLDEYIFAASSVLLVTSSENPMFEVNIVNDQLNRRLAIMGTAYLGALVLNPKGVVRVANFSNTF